MVLGGVKICANFRRSRLFLPCLDTIGKNSRLEVPSKAAQNGVSCDFRVVDVVVYFLSNFSGRRGFPASARTLQGATAQGLTLLRAINSKGGIFMVTQKKLRLPQGAGHEKP